MKKRILIISQEPVSERMGGIGIRQYEFARELSRKFHITMTTPYPTNHKSDNFELKYIPYDDVEFYEKIICNSDIVYINNVPLSIISILERYKKYVVVDLFPIYHFENLERRAADGSINDAALYGDIDVLRRRLKIGDFFICASERERDYYLGLLTSEKKIPFGLYSDDKNFNKIIELVPMGISTKLPEKTGKIMRGVIKGIKEDDFLMIWSGSIWDWYDIETLLKALAIAVQKNIKIKLVFVSTHHPTDRKQKERFQSLLNLASSLNLIGNSLFILEGWIPYEERQNYLLEADVAVVINSDHTENHFSYRIRMVDFIWAALPVISTRGNYFSDLIEREGIGRVVGFQDTEGLAEEFLNMSVKHESLQKFSKKMKKIRKEFYWENILQPLISFCENPRKLKPNYENQWPEVAMSEMKSQKVENILVLRSSLPEDAEKAIINLKYLYPSSSIDLLLQPSVTNFFPDNGYRVRKIPYSRKTFDPDYGEKYFQELMHREGEYDLAICTFLSSNIDYYGNVMKFMKYSRAKKYMAFTHKGVFVDIDDIIK